MTPAIDQLKKAGITYRIHRYKHDPAIKNYGEEAAEKLGISFDRLFKTLVVSLENSELSVAVVPVSRQLDEKAFARSVGSKKAGMADKHKVERSTGYLSGGISPIGQKKKLTTRIDRSALQFDTVYVSAGRRGLQIELSPTDLKLMTHADFGSISR